MATALEEITGGVPKAPRPPDPEDVLGPPPHAPHIGGRGKALSRVQSLRRHAPSPPRVGRTPGRETPPPVVVQQAPAPQPKPGASTLHHALARREGTSGQDSYVARRGLGRKPAIPRANRQRAAAAVAPLRTAPPAEAGEHGEGMSPEVRAKRAEQYKEMQATLDALRRPAHAADEGGDV